MLEQALPKDARVRLVRDTAAPAAEVHVTGLPQLRLEFVRRAAAAGIRADARHVPVLTLRTRNPRERERLRWAGRNFIDLAGAVHIRAPGFYIDRSDLSPVPTRPSVEARGDPYTDVASRVVRTLLMAPAAQAWSIRGLAEAAGVDPSTASRTIRELRRRELVRDERPGERRRSEIRIPVPEALIEDWARSYRWLDNPRLRLAAPVGSPKRFMARLPKLLQEERWALALQAGAAVLAPHASLDIVHAYVDVESDAELEEIALERDWEPSGSGKLVLLRPHYAESVWFQVQEVRGLPVVSPVQLVIDLWHYPVRGREQAEHLVDTILRPIWESSAEPN